MMKITFQWYDYAIFIFMSSASLMTGLYFGCFGIKQSTPQEYLLGDKKISKVPITVSLIASHISGVTLLAVPANVYLFGASYWLMAPALIPVAFISNYVFLPVFFKTKVTSVYTYLEKRFDARTKNLSSVIFILSNILYLPLVIYVPALVFSTATGINLHYIIPFICVICVFYTAIGGMKAIVWTSILQLVVSVSSILIVLYLGIKSNGFSHIWNKSLETNHLNIFNFEFNVNNNDNFWAPFVGFIVLWISLNNTNQGCIQKLLALSTLKEARLATIWFTIGMFFSTTLITTIGLVIFTTYPNCEPFVFHNITRNDQLLPFYVLSEFSQYPGLAGIFIAGIFGATLTSLATHLNSLAGTIYEDLITHKYKEAESNILKIIVLICGIVCMALVFVFEHLGNIFPLVMAVSGVTAGPLLGIFLLGILSKRANAKGAFWGGIIGFIIVCCIALPAKYFQVNESNKSLFEEKCIVNATRYVIDKTPSIFKISYYYYTLIGCVFSLMSGLLISYCTKFTEIHEDLLCPLM